MQREFFCVGCGLFYWEDVYSEKVPGSGTYTCPNCHNLDGTSVFAVDTFTYAYFCDSEYGEEALKKKWSSLKYAPEDVIQVYKKQGFKIS